MPDLIALIQNGLLHRTRDRREFRLTDAGWLRLGELLPPASGEPESAA